MTPPHPGRALTVFVLAAALAACSEEATEPTGFKPHQPAPIVLLKAEVASALLIGVTDAIQRVLPTFDGASQLSALKDALSSLTAALTTRELADLSTSADRFRVAFDGYAASRDDSLVDPDLGSVRLLLDQVLDLSINPPLDTLHAK